MGERFRPIPEDERPKPVFPDVERGPEPEVKYGQERAKPAPLAEPQAAKGETDTTPHSHQVCVR